MSDTPRTDKYAGTWASTPSNGVTIYEHARKLEREADKLAKQCVKNVEEIGQLRAQLESETKRRLGAEACLKSWKEDEGADAKRLEWLDNHVGLYDVAEYFRHDLITHDQMQTLSLREGIDAAMAMEAQNDDV